MSAGLSGALVPHAPALLPEVVGHEVASDSEELRRAVASLSWPDADLLVVLSPHALQTCVYQGTGGSLDDFGIGGIELERPTDADAANALASAWGCPLVPAPVDYGALVPLMLLATGDTPVVAAGLADLDAPGNAAEDAIAAGRSFGAAVTALTQRRNVALVVSAHTSAALTPRAPLTERAEAKPVEESVIEALDGDPATVETSLEALAREGGSCCPGTLAAYAEAFGGRRSEVLAYAYPFGVGYVVARVA